MKFSSLFLSSIMCVFLCSFLPSKAEALTLQTLAELCVDLCNDQEILCHGATAAGVLTEDDCERNNTFCRENFCEPLHPPQGLVSDDDKSKMTGSSEITAEEARYTLK